MAKTKTKKQKEFQLSMGDYEITINPCDRFQYMGRSMRFVKFIQGFVDNMKSSMKDYGIKYNLVVECSSPHINVNKENSNMPRLHYHGIIYLRDPLQVGLFLTYCLYNLSRWSNVTINELRTRKWDEYMHKNSHIWKPYCRIMKLPYVITQDTLQIRRKC